MPLQAETDMADAVKGAFRNGSREVPVGTCKLDVVDYDKQERLFSVVECKLGTRVTAIGQAFGQIAAYRAVIAALTKDFIDAYTRQVPLRYGRIMEATENNRQIRVAFYVALTEAALEQQQIDLIRSLKQQQPNVGIIRVKADGTCKRSLKANGERDYKLAEAAPVVIEILR